jgi:hypothetical protein
VACPVAPVRPHQLVNNELVHQPFPFVGDAVVGCRDPAENRIVALLREAADISAENVERAMTMAHKTSMAADGSEAFF